jgi:hypothetical protein
MSSPAFHFVQAISVLGALFFAQEVPDVLGTDWVAAVERLGLAAVFVVFFIITSWLRENRMAKRLDKLEQQNSKMGSRLAELTEKVTEAMKRDTDIIRDALDTLKIRPCLAFSSAEEFRRWQKSQEQG